MRFLSFEVEGFKNFGQRLVLEDLQPVNLIHGENNVGKSNLLHAMRLFLAIPRLTGGVPADSARMLTEDAVVRLGFKGGARDIFSLDAPLRPIRLAAVLRLEGDDLRQVPLEVPSQAEKIDLYLGYELVRKGEGAEVECTLIAQGAPWLDLSRIDPGKVKMEAISEEVQRFIGGEFDRPRFDLLDTHRLVEKSTSALASVFYDFRDSELAHEIQIFERFNDEILKHFGELIGEGKIWFNKTKVERRDPEVPNKIWVEEIKSFSFRRPGKEPVSFHLLGTGVQQMFVLLGHLLATKASMVGVEEPEMNLRYSNQRKLGEILKDMVGKPGAPSQIFMTSHSPALEQGRHFYLMEKGADGPRVRIRPIKEARRATGMADDERLPPAGEADSCYVSTEGVTIVPKDVMEIIGIPDGGGVMYLEMDPEMCSKVKSNIMRVLSDEDFVKEFGISDDGEPGDGQ